MEIGAGSSLFRIRKQQYPGGKLNELLKDGDAEMREMAGRGGRDGEAATDDLIDRTTKLLATQGSE